MSVRERLSITAAFIALLIAVFVVGSAFRWTQAIVAICMAGAIVPLVWSRRSLGLRSPLLWCIGLAIGLTLLQLLPLPDAVIRTLQPVGSSLRDEGAALAGTSPWRSLSLDPGSTLRCLCFFIVLFAAAIIGLRLAVSERGRYRLLATIAGLCGLAALIVWIHQLIGASSLYGIYTPEQAHPSVLGPLLNENHLGCLMAMGAMLSLGLTMYARQRTLWRSVWLGLTALCSATAVASQSRGATLALLGGFLLTGVMLIAQRLLGVTGSSRPRRSFATTSLPLTIIASCSIVVVVYISAGGVSDQLERTQLSEIEQPLSKFAIWRSTFTLIEETPWVGVGRGAFEPSFTRAHAPSAVHSFSHVENEYIQAAADWGVPGAILLGLAGIAVVVRGFRRWRDGPLNAGALGALAVVAVQSNVDFGVELLGLALPTTLVAAVVAYGSLREVSGRRRLWTRIAAAALALSLLGAAALLLTDHTKTIMEDHEDLAGDPQIALAQVSAELERHPLDYYGFAIGSQLLARDRNPRAVAFLNQALVLHPTHPGLHHLAARMLYDVGQLDQASIEYSLALMGAMGSQPLIEEITERFQPEQAAASIPLDYEHLDQIVKLLLELKREKVATQWILRALDMRVGDLKACRWLYSLAVRSEDIDAADLAAKRCKRVSPSYRDRVAIARMLLNKQRPAEALQAVEDVEDWPVRVDIKASGWIVRCDALAAQGTLDTAESCLHHLDSTGYVPDNQRGMVTSRLQKIDAQLHPR